MSLKYSDIKDKNCFETSMIIHVFNSHSAGSVHRKLEMRLYRGNQSCEKCRAFWPVFICTCIRNYDVVVKPSPTPPHTHIVYNFPSKKKKTTVECCRIDPPPTHTHRLILYLGKSGKWAWIRLSPSNMGLA